MDIQEGENNVQREKRDFEQMCFDFIETGWFVTQEQENILSDGLTVVNIVNFVFFIKK